MSPPTPAAAASTDPRTRNTRAWIVKSFNALFFRRPYRAINVAEIAGKAGVGRSTFYEHFRNKDEVLRRSMRGMLGMLADAATDAGNIDRIRWVLEHFWENRATARAMVGSPSWDAIASELADLFEVRLRAMGEQRGTTTIIPIRLAAIQLAQSQLGLIRAWLEGAGGVQACSSGAMAEAVLGTTRSAVRSHVMKASPVV